MLIGVFFITIQGCLALLSNNNILLCMYAMFPTIWSYLNDMTECMTNINKQLTSESE